MATGRDAFVFLGAHEHEAIAVEREAIVLRSLQSSTLRQPIDDVIDNPIRAFPTQATVNGLKIVHRYTFWQTLNRRAEILRGHSASDHHLHGSRRIGIFGRCHRKQSPSSVRHQIDKRKP